MRIKSIDDLKRFEFLSHLNDDELEKIIKHTFQRTYEKNQILFTVGDPRERIYFLSEGFVRLEKTNIEATMMYLDYVKPYDLFPYEGMFRDTYYHYSAYALTDIHIFYIPTSIFESIVQTNKELLQSIISYFSELLKQHENRLQTLATTNVKDRVEQSITYLIKKFGVNQGSDMFIDIPMTISEIAKMTGTCRETVSHVFKDLRSDGLITMEARHITVHDNEYFLERAQ